MDSSTPPPILYLMKMIVDRVTQFSTALRNHNVPFEAMGNALCEMLFTVPWKLSYKTAVEESDDQASSSLKQLNKLPTKGIDLFSSGEEEDIRDDLFLSKGSSTEKKIGRK
uniref:Uncharacterized protein n=1 Tax=Romanomermis culicivorax TaxID=13658 RepID=A0A915I8U3_ROMCU